MIVPRTPYMTTSPIKWLKFKIFFQFQFSALIINTIPTKLSSLTLFQRDHQIFFFCKKQPKIETISMEINKLTFNGLVTVTVSIVVIGAILDDDGRLELQS